MPNNGVVFFLKIILSDTYSLYKVSAMLVLLKLVGRDALKMRTLGLHLRRCEKSGACRSLRSQQSGSSSPVQTLAKPMLGARSDNKQLRLCCISIWFTVQSLAPTKKWNWSKSKWEDADAQDSCSSSPAMRGSIEVFCSLCQAFGSSESGVHQWAEGAR